ncbi:hypothetical protein ACSBR2_008785 [Camellia fascicularis]
MIYIGIEPHSIHIADLCARRDKLSSPARIMDLPTNDAPVDGQPAATTVGTQSQPVVDAKATVPTPADKPPVPSKAKKARAEATDRVKSKVWDHFDKVKGEDGKMRAYPYREVEKGQSTLSFQFKKDGVEGADLVATTFTVKAARKALAEMNLNYMCLIVHFIDDDWKLQKRIINFCLVEDHKGETIGRKIESCLLEWNIDCIFTLTVDNASSNNTTVKKDWKELNSSIAYVRAVVRYVRSSPNRWNSIYLMLEAAKKFKRAFERLQEDDFSYWAYFGGDEFGGGEHDGDGDGDVARGPPNEAVWNNFNMKAKFDKYWGDGDKINLLLYVAVVLDPRKKLKYLNFCFSQILIEKVVNEMTGKVKDCLTRLYEHYVSHDSKSGQEPNVSAASEMEVDDDCDDPHMLIATQFNSYLEEEYSVVCKSELDKYFVDFCEGSKDENFDILGWWKSNSSKYKVLSQVARDVLVLPGSTVASESTFSTGGRIVNPFRS